MSMVTNSRAPLDVLIAEDDSDVRLAVRQVLEGEGYTCAEAEDGRVAVEVARQRPWSQQLAGALAGLENALCQHAEQMGSGLELLAGVDVCRPTLVRRAAALRQGYQRLREKARALRVQVQAAAQAFQAAPGN